MDVYKELAIESAETAAGLTREKERKYKKNITIRSFRAGSAFGRAGEERGSGEYHTLLLDEYILGSSDISEDISACIAGLLSPTCRRRSVLAVGLGNPKMIVDALGSETVGRLSAGEKKKLSVLIPSVYGVTGLESATIVRAVTREIAPDVVVAVDTLATRRAERLCRAVQISNTGITPGGGVGNKRVDLSYETLGVPVLTVGVPLLMHAECCADLPTGTVVTPKEIDLYVPAFAKALGQGIERALFE